MIDDIATTTGVTVDIGVAPSFTTINSTLYRFRPDNALARGRPPFIIEANPWYQWLLWGWQIRVTAVWGWPAVPDPITDACILLASRLFRRKDSPEGVAGFNDLGVVRVGRYDPDYDALIGPYERKEM